MFSPKRDNPGISKEETMTRTHTAQVTDATGADADTSALIVGRSVAVWISDGAIDASCVPTVQAERVVLRN